MATTDRLQGLNIGAAVKPACAVATTANVTLSGEQTVDGITVGSCERVLVRDQTDTKENGIYLADSSTWTRAQDFDGSKDAIPGTILYVDRGNTYATSFWAFNSSSTATDITIGTDNISVDRVTIALAGVTSYSQSLLALASSAAWKSTDGLNLGSAANEAIGNNSTNVPVMDSTGLIWTGVQSWNKGSDVASANTLTLNSSGNYFDITGGTSITKISGISVGTEVTLQFDSTLVLTHDATGLKLPGSANIVTAAGDHATFVEYASSSWRCINYEPVSGEAITAQTGTIKQVVSTQKTDTFSTTSATATDITGLSLNITPTSTANKVICMVNGSYGVSANNVDAFFYLDRDGTNIGIGDTAGSRNRATFVGGMGTGAATVMTPFMAHWYDSPGTTSAVTYKLQMSVETATGYVGRSHTDTDSTAWGRSGAQMTLWEVST